MVLHKLKGVSQLLFLVLLVVFLSLPSIGNSTVVDNCGNEATPTSPPISPQANSLISKIGAMKKKASVSLQKIDNSLWPDLPVPLDNDIRTLLQEMRPSTSRRKRSFPSGATLIEVEIRLLSNTSVPVITAYCEKYGQVIFSSAEFTSVSAWLPPTRIVKLSHSPDVLFIAPPSVNQLNKINVSGGVISHRVDKLRTYLPNLAGNNVKVGIISDSIDLDIIAQATGDLPPNIYVLSGAQGWGLSEGAAMAELIYDIAPNATLYFATAFGSEAAYAHNIINLASLGCKVIVDNIYYFQEPVFEDGPIAQAVKQATDMGVLYFSAAGNQGNTMLGSASTYEGDYAPTPWVTYGSELADFYLDVHAFSFTQAYNTITGAPRFVTIHWSDPYFYAYADYDLFIFDGNGTMVSFSATSHISFEIASTYYLPYGTYYIVVARYSGPVRAISIRVYDGLLDIATPGFIFGHAAVETAFAVGAIQDISPDTYIEREKHVYLVPETFTSEGPRRIFYENGFPITFNDVTFATGGKTRNKPDFVAADGVATAIPGFQPFYGTSASAAHAAGIAALAVEAYPYLTFAQLQYAIYLSAVPILNDKSVNNHLTGFGALDAVNLVYEIISDECSPNPCQHGGTCTDWFKSYTCACTSGFCGVSCQNPC